jgi:hypothetical protein
MLSIDRFAFNLGIDPLHINGVNHGSCGSPVLQYAWQHPGRIGREEIALAIQHAEDVISDALGFYPLPVWREELIPISVRAKQGIVICSHGMVLEAGQLAKTLIDSDLDVTYGNEDSDDFNELATITVTTSVTDPEEIGLYYPSKDGDDAWEIRPIGVSITGGEATITCKRWQLVDPFTLEDIDPDPDGIELEDDASFLTKVDVYRKWTDPSVQAQFEGYAYPCVSCNDVGCASCQASTQSACVQIRDSLIGALSVSPATWDVDNSRFTFSGWPCLMSRPKAIRVWHRSGYKDPRTSSSIRMAPRFERAIALLAISLIGEDDLCTCLQALHSRWAQDYALQESSADGSSTSYKMGKKLEWPFGTTRGAIEAWNLVREVRNGLSIG